MTVTAKKNAARDRIVDTAYRLFYEQGYLATGINQIIEEAEVSKATFYNHFPSKEDLCLVYAQERDRREWDEIHALMAKYKTPEDRFLGPLLMLEPWLKSVNFRGCCFQNLISEITSAGHPARKEAARHKGGFKDWLRGLTIELKESGERYRDIDVDHLSEVYNLVYEGCMVLAEVHADPAPVRQAIHNMRRLAGIPE